MKRAWLVLGLLSAGAFAPAEVIVSNPARGIACDSSALLTMSTATTTQMVALASGKTIYVCGFAINGAGSTTLKLVAGTGTNCGTGQTNLTPAFSLASGTTVALGGGVGVVLKTAAGNALCATNSAAVTANVFVTYTQY